MPNVWQNLVDIRSVFFVWTHGNAENTRVGEREPTDLSLSWAKFTKLWRM